MDYRTQNLMRKMQKVRIAYDVLLCVAIFVLPFWLSCLIAFVALLAIPYYWEFIVVFLSITLLYSGMPFHGAHHWSALLPLIAVFLFVLVHGLRFLARERFLHSSYTS